jgi:hypothetical protein
MCKARVAQLVSDKLSAKAPAKVSTEKTLDAISFFDFP